MKPWPYINEPECWRPDHGVTSHAGQPLRENAVFFAPPPPEIGKVLTASSTLRAGERPWPTVVPFLFSTIPAAAVAGALLWLRDEYFDAVPRIAGIVSALIAAAIIVGLVRWMMAFRRECAYTGEKGVARFTIGGNPRYGPKVERLLFADAAELRARQERLFINGIYAGSDFTFVWTDSQKKRALTLKGKFRSKHGTPKPTHPFHFAKAAEAAWNGHLVHRLQVELDQKGFVEFSINKDDWVRVGPGFLEITTKNVHERLAVTDIKTFTIGAGTFKIQHKDAGWLGRKGKWSFEYGKLANAQMFLFAIDRLLGMRFGET